MAYAIRSVFISHMKRTGRIGWTLWTLWTGIDFIELFSFATMDSTMANRGHSGQHHRNRSVHSSRHRTADGRL